MGLRGCWVRGVKGERRGVGHAGFATVAAATWAVDLVKTPQRQENRSENRATVYENRENGQSLESREK